jgi:ribosome-associated protein
MLRTSHGGRSRKPPPGPARASRADGAAKQAAPTPSRSTPREPKKTRSTGPAVPAGVSEASDEAREVAVTIAVAAIEKKASGLEVIDVAGKVDYADFLVLMSGRSDRHVTALASAIEEALRKRNKRALAVEGLPHANWVLMDFGDVVVHVFQDDARATYDIDSLWMDARRVPVPLPKEPS